MAMRDCGDVTPGRAFEFDVAVLGLGLDGLSTALSLHSSGRRVLAVDASKGRLVAVGVGLVDLDVTHLLQLDLAMTDPDFQLSADASMLSMAQTVVVCPASSSTRDLQTACGTVVNRVVAGQLLLLTMAAYLGCTADLLVEPVACTGLAVGRNVFVAFTAACADDPSEVHDGPASRIVGGATDECLRRATPLIADLADTVTPLASLASAETTQLLEQSLHEPRKAYA